MTTPVTLAANSASPAAKSATGGDRERLAQAAKQFEAIFLRQVLSSARAADFGGDDTFGGQGEETFLDMRDSQFADIASKSGAIGFAASIEKQLARFVGPEA